LRSSKAEVMNKVLFSFASQKHFTQWLGLCLISSGLNMETLVWADNKVHNKLNNIDYNLVSWALLFPQL
jgi:hypothetical protein